MAKKIILTIVGLLALLAGLAMVKFAPGVGQFAVMGAAGANMVMPPEVVTATTVKSENWENTLNSTGSLATVQGVTVSSEMAGKVAKINFESGATVAAGDLLVQLDVQTEEAQLRAAEANAVWAKANLDRLTDLLAKNAVAKSDFDLVDAQNKQAIAQVDNIKSVIEKKTIRAPFSGRLGIRLINLGQILKEGDSIVTLQTLDPIYVNFSLPQQELASINTGSKVRLKTEAASGDVFEGKVTAVNPDVDVTTRNFRVQATLPNPGEKLRPGMFAKVEVVLPATEKVLAIPATSVLYAPYGDSVFVVDEGKDPATGQPAKILRQQFVRLGETRGDFVTVVDGLKEGESVVTSGVFKLRPGMSVVIDNRLAPNAQLAPKPENT
jgi:membrane fusion protein, multidrug efflux system